MSFRSLKGLALIFATLIFAVPVATAAPDGPGCSEPVLDTTTSHVLDVKKVQDAVDEVQRNTGAHIYVRAMQSVPDASSNPGAAAKRWMDEMVSSCPNWRGPDGVSPDPKLLVIEFSMDHTSGISYGSAWVDRLGESGDSGALWHKIVQRELNANLKKGDFTKAVTDSLSALDTAMNGKDPYAFNWGPVKVVGKIVALVALALATLWGVLLGVAGGIRGAARKIREHQELRKDFAGEIAEIEALKREGSELMLTLNPELTADTATASLSGIPEEDIAAYSTDISTAHENIKTELIAIAGYLDEPLPARPSRSAMDEVSSFREKFAGSISAVKESTNFLESVPGKIQEEAKKYSADGLAADIGDLRNVLSQTSSTVSGLTDDGFSVERRSTRSWVPNLVKRAEKMSTKLDGISSSGDLKARIKARSVVDAVTGEVEDIGSEAARIRQVADVVMSAAEEVSSAVREEERYIRNADADTLTVQTGLSRLLASTDAAGRYLKEPRDGSVEHERRRLGDVVDAIRRSSRSVRAEEAAREAERQRKAAQARAAREAARHREAEARIKQERLDAERRRRDESWVIASAGGGHSSRHSSSSSSGGGFGGFGSSGGGGFGGFSSGGGGGFGGW